MQKAGEQEKRCLTWKHKTNWHRETGNTGINTLWKLATLGGGGENHKDR
jgi:hypothetical protein